MRKKTPQDYANELIKMYRENGNELNRIDQLSETNLISSPAVAPRFEDGTGGLQVNVTTLNTLYPVKNALVTVFTGPISDMTVIETSITDQSGQSGVFNLKTPPIADSQQAENGGNLPYANYNVSVRSDGYVEQIAMNVPIFSGVVSVQGIDLISISAAGGHTAPQIINEENKYEL